MTSCRGTRPTSSVSWSMERGASDPPPASPRSGGSNLEGQRSAARRFRQLSATHLNLAGPIAPPKLSDVGGEHAVLLYLKAHGHRPGSGRATGPGPVPPLCPWASSARDRNAAFAAWMRPSPSTTARHPEAPRLPPRGGHQRRLQAPHSRLRGRPKEEDRTVAVLSTSLEQCRAPTMGSDSLRLCPSPWWRRRARSPCNAPDCRWQRMPNGRRVAAASERSNH